MHPGIVVLAIVAVIAAATKLARTKGHDLTAWGLLALGFIPFVPYLPRI